MKTYDLAVLTKRVVDAPWPFYSSNQLQALLGIRQESSLFKVVQRLVKAGVLDRVERGKYIRADYSGSPFKLANFLYQPSYVSFESALSFHGILSQFPAEITSVTTGLGKQKKFSGRVYGYYRIQPRLYWGYFKQEGYLMAEPEKAVLDQAYLAAKGLKPLPLEEYDMTKIDMPKLKNYARQFGDNVGRYFSKF